jgi:hypothetical protein
MGDEPVGIAGSMQRPFRARVSRPRIRFDLCRCANNPRLRLRQPNGWIE